MANSSIGLEKPRLFGLALGASIGLLLLGCSDEDKATTLGGTGEGGKGGAGGMSSGPGGAGGSAGGAGGMGGSGPCGDDVKAPEEVLADTTDPEAGDFTLDEALADLPQGPGPLRAIIETDLGTVTCELFPNEAPIGVANFVGLARGKRAWKDPVTKKWVKRRFYDGLLFHRVIDNFVVQGGDPLGTGFGGPGYKFINEIAGLTHVAGALAYANSGANTNGSQFYITETPQPGLDGDYTIFGVCEPLDVISTLAAVPVDPQQRPQSDLHIVSITITRCAPAPE
jgi:peptidyl-prolyl cis-trans isomerase A (cyclophilin A)